MYLSQETANRINTLAKSKKIAVKDLLYECGLNKNTISTMISRKSWIKADSLALIADHLGCSVDYLLGRQESGLNEDENDLITAYRQSSSDTKKAACAVLGIAEGDHKPELRIAAFGGDNKVQSGTKKPKIT